jgi:hypothetical protein
MDIDEDDFESLSDMTVQIVHVTVAQGAFLVEIAKIILANDAKCFDDSTKLQNFQERVSARAKSLIQSHGMIGGDDIDEPMIESVNEEVALLCDHMKKADPTPSKKLN